MPKTVTVLGKQRIYDSIFTTMTITRSTVYTWVACFLAIGNPDTYEFIEVGYTQTVGGFYIYSSSEIQGVYQKIGYPATLGETYDFSIYGTGTLAYALPLPVFQSVVFSNVDNMLCVIQGETTYADNSMYNTFTEIKAEYWADVVDIYNNGSTVESLVHKIEKWQVAHIEAINVEPYTMTYTTASPYVETATVSGGLPHRGSVQPIGGGSWGMLFEPAM